jgi:hypothetical protein
MVIPRENKLVRLYIQLTTTEKGGFPVSNVLEMWYNGTDDERSIAQPSHRK